MWVSTPAPGTLEILSPSLVGNLRASRVGPRFGRRGPDSSPLEVLNRTFAPMTCNQLFVLNFL